MTATPRAYIEDRCTLADVVKARQEPRPTWLERLEAINRAIVAQED